MSACTASQSGGARLSPWPPTSCVGRSCWAVAVASHGSSNRPWRCLTRQQQQTVVRVCDITCCLPQAHSAQCHEQREAVPPCFAPKLRDSPPPTHAGTPRPSAAPSPRESRRLQQPTAGQTCTDGMAKGALLRVSDHLWLWQEAGSFSWFGECPIEPALPITTPAIASVGTNLSIRPICMDPTTPPVQLTAA